MRSKKWPQGMPRLESVHLRSVFTQLGLGDPFLRHSIPLRGCGCREKNLMKKELGPFIERLSKEKGVDVLRKAKEPLLYERHTIKVVSDTNRRRRWAIELGFERNGDCHWTTSQRDLRRKEQEYPSIMINYKLRCALHFSPICYHYYLV